MVVVASERFFCTQEKIRWILLWLRTKGCKGRDMKIGRQFRVNAGSHFCVGKNVQIGDRCNFEIGIEPEAQLTIGDNTWISRDLHLNCTEKIVIGKNVLIGEFVSIRDMTHSYEELSVPIMEQSDLSAALTIEDDVWIGRGCLIQSKPPGIVIGKGAIVGANAVVTRSIPPMEVWGGVPAKFLKCRIEHI